MEETLKNMPVHYRAGFIVCLYVAKTKFHFSGLGNIVKKKKYMSVDNCKFIILALVKL